MNECQLGSVKSLPRRAAGVFVRRLSGCVRVELFAAQRMTNFREMNANLMRAAGFEAAFEDGLVAEVFERADVGDGAAGVILVTSEGGCFGGFHLVRQRWSLRA